MESKLVECTGEELIPSKEILPPMNRSRVTKGSSVHSYGNAKNSSKFDFQDDTYTVVPVTCNEWMSLNEFCESKELISEFPTILPFPFDLSSDSKPIQKQLDDNSNCKTNK